MKHDWEYKKLGEVATYINGYAFKPEEWMDNGLPIIRIQNLNNESASYNYFDGEIPSKYIVNKGDLLISWSASLGAYIWQGDKAFLNQHIFKVVFDKSDISKYYLKLVVESKLAEMSKSTHGATMKHITKKDFDNVEIPVPPLPTQQSIVSELDSLSQIIADCKETLKDYDALEQSIFYDMFGDPVKNEKGWEVKKLGDIATCTIGLTYKPEDVSPSSEGIIVLRSGNIQQSVLDFEDIVRVTSKVPEKKFVEDGDILMCTRNGSFRLVGKVAKIIGLQERMSYGAFMTIIRSQHNTYLFEYFRTSAFRESLIQGQTSTVNQITVKMLNELSLPIPPLPLQQQFASKIEAIEQMKSETKKALQEAETLFNARMDYWFN